MQLRHKTSIHARIVAALFVIMASLLVTVSHADPLKVFTTVPDLAALAVAVGGEHVQATSMVNGSEDAHFVEAKPSFVKRLSEADVFITVGLGLEVGYEDTLLVGARNAEVMPGRPGNIVTSIAVQPINLTESGVVTRALGDVHVGGNPHFLTDPLSGLEVAALIATRFGELRPAESTYFETRLEEFRRRVGSALVGNALDAKYDGTKLAVLYQRGALKKFLDEQGDTAALSGWLGAMLPHYGTKAVDDHPMWPYFARTFGIKIVGHLEPRPGIRPTTKHLKEIIDRMREDDVKVIIQSSYYDPRHAQLVAEQTGASVAELAHQVHKPESYVEFINGNVDRLVEAIGHEN